eukprot:TRINITY_DN1714_c0_g2_i4.p1 TRINITY_DN1714_c0_g2~~TRINITY_DN1714_c0_g2_i4.p1  ORF type:complete len:675 (+),score=98.43 TRINITY_DN1714_c0_g2_i4:76-2100(+)
MAIQHTNVCTHWLKGGCRYGADCKFEHPPSDKGTIQKRGQSNNAGKDGRHTAVRRLIMSEFDLQTGETIVEVAGGKGILSIELQNLENIPCTLIEPRNDLDAGLESFSRKLKLNMYHRSPVLGAPRVSYSDCLSREITRPHHCRIFFTDDLADSRGTESQLALFNKYCESPSPTTDEDSHASMHLKSDEIPSKQAIQESIASAREQLQKCTLIIGLHPDGPTEDIINYALLNKKNFVIIPCCVFAESNKHRVLKNGQIVRSYEDFITYLCEKDSRIRKLTLTIAGRNIALVFNAKDQRTETDITTDFTIDIPPCIKAPVVAIGVFYAGRQLELSKDYRNWSSLLSCLVASMIIGNQDASPFATSQTIVAGGLSLVSCSLGLTNSLKVATCAFAAFSASRLVEICLRHVRSQNRTPTKTSATPPPPPRLIDSLDSIVVPNYNNLSIPPPVLSLRSDLSSEYERVSSCVPKGWSVITGSKNPSRYTERRPQKKLVFMDEASCHEDSDKLLNQFITSSLEYSGSSSDSNTKTLIVGNHGRGSKGIVLQPMLSAYFNQLSEGGEETVLAQRFDHWMHSVSGKVSVHSAFLDFRCRITGNSCRSLHPATDLQLFFRLQIPARPCLLSVTVALYPFGKCPVSSYSDVDEFINHEASLNGYTSKLLHHNDGRLCNLVYRIE